MSQESPLPLAGIKVIELADGLGEMCGRMLADFGADVVKVEPPGGAKSRKMAPLTRDGKNSCYFLYRNFNKRGVVLDLTQKEDAAELKKLLAGADILLESFKPGTLADMGLDPKELIQEFPHLIVTSITPFGQTGPYSQYEATEQVLFALSGWLSTCGIPEKPPITAPGYMSYDLAGIMGCFGTLLALRKRIRTGLGQHLDVSALEAANQCATWGLPNTSAILYSGSEAPRIRSGSNPMYTTFKANDGYVRLVILSPRQWQAMWQWLGQPEEFKDPSWEQAFERIINADVLNPYFARLIDPQKMEACAAEAQERGVVITPMLKPSDILGNEHFASRNSFREEEVVPGVVGKIMDGWLEVSDRSDNDGSKSRERLGFRFRAPQLGEHTDEVMAEEVQSISLEQNPDDLAALAGLRVMDFGHGGVGVEGSKLLGEYGADVIKIETRTYPDFIRIVLGKEMSPSFASSSKSKRSLGVNAKNPEGLKILQKLAQTSDIAIENNSTGTMDSMELGYNYLTDLNPDIVLASSQMMGSHGAYGKWIGYGPTIATVGGIDWLWGYDDGDPPPGTPHIHPDHMAGRVAAIAGLLGIIARERHGHAFHAEIAQVENLMCTLGDFFLAESIDPGSVRPQANDAGGEYSHKDGVWGPFECAGSEEWCVINSRGDTDWDGMLKAMGNPEWAAHKDFASRESRTANREKLRNHIKKWTKELTPRQVMEKCQAEGVPAGAMLFSQDILEDPHYLARNYIRVHDQQDVDTQLAFEGPCISGTNLPDVYFRQAPRLGEHTREICEQDLGLTPKEVDELIELKVLELPNNPDS